MLIKWEGGNPPQGGFPNAISLAAILVNIFAVVVSGIPSSIPTPVTVLADSIGRPTTAASYPAVATGSSRRVPKQVGHSMGATIATPTDHQSAGTHHGHGHGFMDHHGHGHHGLGHHHHHGDGKYFTYAHNPGYDEYEYGYRRGNDYHFQERYEKYGPSWNFKTKVKWGDKYGGYGEHYWDYNHAGSGGHDDGGGGHGHGHYSEPVPTYENQPTASNKYRNVAVLNKRQSDGTKKEKRSKTSSKRISSAGEGASNKDEAEMNTSPVEVYPSFTVGDDSKVAESREVPTLVLDRKTGQIIDTQTGKAYLLKPHSHRSYY